MFFRKNRLVSLHPAIFMILIAGLVMGLNSNSQAANKYLVTDIKVKDGDTFNCTIHLGFGVALTKQEIRCADFDAWESSYRRNAKGFVYDQKEIEKGKLAKLNAEEILNN